MHFLIIFIFATQILRGAWGSKKSDKFVPGCPSEHEYDFSRFETDNVSDYSDLPSCYCDNSTQDSNASTKFIQVSCYLSSKPEHLTLTLEKVRTSGKFVDSLFISNMEFTDRGISDGYFKSFGITPRSITISVCNGNDKRLNLGNGTFDGLENSLKILKIYDCFLENFPISVRSLKNLESLTIQQVFIHTLDAEDLRQMHNLKHLDLSINSMYYVEPGSFKPLEKLEILILGPSNAFNDSIFGEINELKSLKFLDLSANSIGNLPDNSLHALKNLHTLDLQYNLIKRLKRHSFTGLKSLKNLYLTANLINYTEFSAFDEDLTNLKTLYLQYNRLHFLDSKTFFNLRNLEKVDLSYNDLQAFRATLLDTNTKLKFLNISNNKALAYIEDGSLNGAISLENLNLHVTNLSGITAKTLADLKNLHTLNLSETELSDIDQMAFKDQIKLEKLDLSSTKLMLLDQNSLKPIQGHLKYLDLSDNRWLCEKESQWLVKYLQENTKNNSNHGFVVNVENTQCWMPLDYRGLSVAQLDANTMRPIHTLTTDKSPPFAAAPLNVVDGSGAAPSAKPFDLFAAAADVTMPGGWTLGAGGDALGGFQTLAPNGAGGGGDHLDVKTLVASIVGAGVAVTAAVAAVVVLLMKRRRSRRKRATNGENSDVGGAAPTSMELRKKPEGSSSRNLSEIGPNQKIQMKRSSEEEMHDVQL